MKTVIDGWISLLFVVSIMHKKLKIQKNFQKHVEQKENVLEKKSLRMRKILKWKKVQFSRSVVPNSSWPHGLQHTRPPCPSPAAGACSNSCPSTRWCHPTISSSVGPFSSCLQSFPASGSFPVSQFFASGGQSIRVSAAASVLLMSIHDWFPLGLTGWISL